MKIGVLLSGGVDSSYSAYLLLQEGHEVEGFYLKLHDDESKHKQNIKNVLNVGRNLNITINIIEAQQEFQKEVYEYFVNAYKQGLTPNPCAMCNMKIKFGVGLNKVLQYGCDKIASGHYARVENGYIQEAVDLTKDQSYFLYGLQKETRERLIFPLGEKRKEDIKVKAFEVMPWLGELEKYQESQEICFVNSTYVDILSKYYEVNRSGVIKNKNNEIIGKRKGYMHYTVGKRRELDIPLAFTPHFVVDVIPQSNTLIAGEKEDLKTFEVKAINFSLPDSFEDGQYFVKTRYRSNKVNATVRKFGDNIEAKLHEPIYGVAKGQVLVIYKNDLVLGGGLIL